MEGLGDALTHKIDTSMQDLAVIEENYKEIQRQRDTAWDEVDRLKKMNEDLERELAQAIVALEEAKKDG